MGIKLDDLNGILMDSLLRITNDDLKGDELKEEIARSKAITDTATQIIKNTGTQLRAAELFVKAGKELPISNVVGLLSGGDKNAD